ncbi:MAG: RNA polymerase sigma factor [Nitrososphaeria archaeon]|jgi:RNA polymerase sigma factor (sigma-70 family)
MKINDAYALWKNNPDEKNYELFGEALLRYVYGFVRKRYGSAYPYVMHEAIIMDSITRILKEIDAYDAQKSTFSTWVGFKIKDTLATLWKARVELNEYQGVYDYHSAPNKFHGIDAKILLKQLMQTLSVDERRLVELQLEGLEDEEIALELGIPVGTVWSRWNRVKEKMRKAGE